MSMHKKPLTVLEEAGLRAHGLDIGKPSQLSDVFRQGVAWALNSMPEEVPEGTMKPLRLVALHTICDGEFDKATYLRVPSDMNMNEMRVKYDDWYRREYLRSLGTSFQVVFMGFNEWLLKNGAHPVQASDIEVYEDV